MSPCKGYTLCRSTSSRLYHSSLDAGLCRNDASLAAAELALVVEKAVLDTGAVDAVGTTGHWQVKERASHFSVLQLCTAGLGMLPFFFNPGRVKEQVQWPNPGLRGLNFRGAQIGPNVLNSVPREARLEIDLRDIDGPRRDNTVAAVLKVGHGGLPRSYS